MLDNPNEPVSDLSYFDCIESVMENSKVSLSVPQSRSSRCSSVGVEGFGHLYVHLPVATVWLHVWKSLAAEPHAQVLLKP